MSNRLVAGGGIQSESISDFDPRTLGGCVLWLDAADSNTLFTDTAGTMLAGNGNQVARWNDKANPGKFVRQNTSALRPAYLKPSNSLPVVNFTGTTSAGQQQFEFSDTSTPPMPVGTDPATYFIVAKPNVYSPSVSGNYVISYGSFTTAGERSIALYGPPNNIARFHTGGPYTDVATGTLPTTIVSAIYSNFTSSLTVNGGTPVIRDVQSSNLNTGTTHYAIGNYLVAGSPFYGYVSEIIVFNRALQNDERQQVEGYLAWKWGLVQNLPVTHPYYYAKAPQTAFQPTSFPSCALWLDAADGNTVIRTGSNVTQWNDKSGNGFNAANSGTPTYSAENREISLASGAGFSFSGPNPIITGANPIGGYTSFAVFNTPSTFATTGRIFGLWDGSSNDFTGPNGLAIIYLNNSGGVNGLVTAQRGGAYPTTVNALDLSTTYLGTVTSTSGGSFSVGINGATTGNLFATSSTASGNYNALTRYFIGRNSVNGEPLNGTIREVLLFNVTLTLAQRQQVEGYLAWKWNLTLPSSHPFTQANYFFNNTRPFSRYFNPPDIEGCQLWIDAADANTVTLNDSGNVTSILDKSGLANNISNTGSTVTYTSTLNSRPVLTFPSTGTVAGNTLSTPSLTRDPVNFSAFYVCRYPSSGASPIQAINFDLSTGISTTISGATNAATTTLTVGSSDQFAIGRHVIITGVTPTGYNQAGVITAIANSTQITVQLSRGAPGVAYTSGGTITQLTASHMFGQDGIVPNFNIQNVNYEAGTASRAITSFTYGSTTLINNTFILGCVRQNGVFTLSTNGVAHSTTPPALTATGNKTTGAYSIFGGVQGLNIAEVIIYNAALTATERQSIEGYLSWKWGIQRATSSTNPSVTSGLTYPSTHPYYNFPPVDVTPMTPALRLYKKPFDPSDLSPVIWIDPQDSNVVTRETGTTNRVTQIVNKGTFAGNFTPPSGIGGPLFTRSSIGNGTGVEFLDFSNGGHYQVTSATMEDATTMALTVFPPHNGEIPLGALVNFTPTRGTYSNGSSATLFTAPIPIIIAAIEVDNRTLTITTSFSHGIGNSQSIYLTVNTATYFGGGDASNLTGQYTTTSNDNTASTIKILLDSDKTAGLMAITDAHIRNNLGTSGPYITQNGTSGSTVKLTTYGTRAIGNLNDFMGRIEYGSLPITSGEIGSSTITLSSVATNIFTASNTSGITNGCPLIPSTSGLGLTGGTMYYVASVSGSTFRLASTLQNVISGTLLTFSNATANVDAVCYGTRATLRTTIDHGISTNQLVNVNLGNQYWLPYQTPAQTAGTCNPAVIQFKTASVAIGGTTLNIDLSTMPTGTQNPFFTLVSGTVTYTTRGTFTIYFPAGSKFGTGASAAEISLTGLSTTANATNNTATKMEFTISPSRPEGTITFDGLPGIIFCTANFATSNANQLNLVATTTSVSGNTITFPIPTSYPGVGGTTIANIGRLLRATGSVEYGQISPLPSILYPVKGFALENTSLSSSLSSTTQTIIIANHLTSVPNRWGRLGSGTQPPIVATATTANGISGGVNTSDLAGYTIRLSAFANAPRLSIRHAAFGNSHNNSSLPFFTDTTNPFRVITTYLNLTSDAIADCPAYSRGESLGAYSYDTLLYNNSGGLGPTRITPGMLQGTINPAHIRIGGETSVGSTYSTTNQLNTHWYEGGVGDILIFNRILPVEERRLVEGYLAQKYRTTGSVGGSAIVINATATYNITGSAAITGSSPNFTITVTGTFTTAFVVGTRVTISGVTTNTGLNNTWTVVSCNTTTLTFLSPTNTLMLWASGNGGTVAGTTAATSGNSIHPYRLNPTTIAGQNTLSLTSTTSTYAQNLVAWFDAANPNLINNATLPANGTPATNNTAVTLWAPTSGWWANTPLQLTNSGTATYHSTTAGRTQNGLGGIYIGGSTNRLSLATGAFTQYTTINANNNFTWTVVFRPDSVSATTPVLSVTNGTSNRLMLCSDGTFIYSNGTTSQTVAPSVLLTNAKTHMITVYRDGATVGFRIVSEDVAIGYSASTSTQTNLKIPTFSTPTLTFGAIGVTGFATSFTGSIFEAALFRSALSTQAIQQVEGYLAWKWGLQGSLPASHAYKELSA